MVDDIDALLEGEDASQSDSQDDKGQQSQEDGGHDEGSQLKSEWESLKGGTQDRVKKLIEEREYWKRQSQQHNATDNRVVPPAPASANPDVKDAINKLREVGIATTDDVKAQIADNMANLTYRYELDRLEGKYTGDDGKPKFQREEYEDYVSRNPQYSGYLPEDVYNIMYKEELMDFAMKHSNSQRSQNSSLKPTRTVKTTEGEMTLEEIEKRLAQSDGPEWYEKNFKRINDAVTRMGQ